MNEIENTSTVRNSNTEMFIKLTQTQPRQRLNLLPGACPPFGEGEIQRLFEDFHARPFFSKFKDLQNCEKSLKMDMDLL